MHLIDQRVLGIASLCLLGTLVLVKRVATGSIFDKPEGSFMVQFVNIFNLFFLLALNPSIVTDGPYRLVRHPMYTAALSISLGLSCLIQSWAVFVVFCIYLVLILLLIPIEENGLRQAYDPSYCVYREKTKTILPFVY